MFGLLFFVTYFLNCRFIYYNHKTINKSKDGIVTYSYNHWEYVDDMLNHLLNDEKWWPQPTVLKDFNKMWKEYK